MMPHAEGGYKDSRRCELSANTYILRRMLPTLGKGIIIAFISRV